MTTTQYIFLTRAGAGLDTTELYAVGDSCYEDGYMDDSGLITPKGNGAISDYEKVYQR